jgi:hypothetical protein
MFHWCFSSRLRPERMTGKVAFAIRPKMLFKKHITNFNCETQVRLENLHFLKKWILLQTGQI